MKKTRQLTKADRKKVDTLLRRLDTLQSDMYYMMDRLKEVFLEEAGETMGDAGFELDLSREKMDRVKSLLEGVR
jgi:hypothetical protein